MNSSEAVSAIDEYMAEISAQLASGQAGEHGYRPAFERLMRSFEDTGATNDPKRSAYGNPDMIFYKKSNHDIILGYAEAKDIGANLDKVIKTEQLHRYAGYNKLFLTNYLEFRFYRNGEEYERISIGKLRDKYRIDFDISQLSRLRNELQAFLELPPEPIKSGKSLARIMGQKARRIRDSIDFFMQKDSDKNQELEKIYDLMKSLLVHDLTKERFADMYAQTLVYGLFAARYNDRTPENFTRQEASELVPASNPFLREFFAHIGGIHFDRRLAIVVDELCQVFSVSNVSLLVEKHLRLFEVDNEKDPIIHFYEDFLKEYDPAERKRMGAYYTPIPVVRFIIREVDRILKEEFGLVKGLADNSKITREINLGQEVSIIKEGNVRASKTSTISKQYHRVQLLDPAVGTATFLNETIKFIAKSFEGQEGRWPAYVNDDLLPRLNGFELMMAPYTIAHLKLGMTLHESGAGELKQRLGVYLTNTLEEGIPRQQDLFSSIGLAAAVTEESHAASEIKHERPIMIVIGNPPYSVSSNNKSDYIQELIKDYKKDLGERKINLDDDYIKFIRFAEEMVAKNGEGIVAMITNNSYIDGITHRQMRKHLLQTFDKIYVLDLHGNSKKKEITPDGGRDENVFDIMQGVSIVLMVKTTQTPLEGGEAYHAEIWGTRKKKFESLHDTVPFKPIVTSEPYYFFTPKEESGQAEYNVGVSLNELFINKASGFRSGDDRVQVCWTKEQVKKVVDDLIDLPEYDYREKYNLKDGRNHNYAGMKDDVGTTVEESRIIQTLYRPFDIRWTYYSKKSSSFVARPRNSTMQHFVNHTNIGLIYKRGYIEERAAPVGVTNLVSHERTWSRAGMQGADTVAPLYLYYDDGTRSSNFEPQRLKKLMQSLNGEYEPELIFDYIYATLHSPLYCEKYKEFLKIDFPRVPVPKSDAEFARMAGVGKQLRELHLMSSSLLASYDTTFPIVGTNEVGQIRYEDSKVWINDQQYFGNVPELAWSFYIGGYQPAQKWLKDRKGHQLSSQEIDHYQKIIKVLLDTNEITKNMDNAEDSR